MASLMPIDVHLPNKFLKEPDEKYKCVQCKNILIPPVVQTTCGHRMCQTCEDDLFHDNIDKPVMCCGGEEDCVMLTHNKIFLDKAIAKELLNLDVFCNNYVAGCTEILPWIKLNVHLETCQFKPVKCDYKDCPLSFPLSMIDVHRENCEFHKIKCSICYSMLTHKDIEMGHEKQCGEIVRPCPLEPFSCSAKGNIKDLEKHSAKALLPHYQSIVHILEENTKKQQHLDESLKKMQHALTEIFIVLSTGSNPASHATKYNDLLKQVAKLNEFFITMKSATQSILTYRDLDGIVGLEEDFGNVAHIHESRHKQLEKDSAKADDNKGLSSTSSSFAKLEIRCVICNFKLSDLDICRIHEKQCAQKVRLCPLETIGCPVNGNGEVVQNVADIDKLQDCLRHIASYHSLRDEDKGKLYSLQITLNEHIQKFDSVERRLKHLEHTIETMTKETDVAHSMQTATLRSELHETTTYDGTLLWKIPNYRCRKQEAVEEKTLSMYSRAFYSNQFGYKMAARVYLNGDKMGKNTHMSLYFVMLKGEYDARQQWPFRQEVKLMLIDKSGKDQHIQDRFLPDPTSPSFRRPTCENIAARLSLFAEHSKVETSQYLVDDAIVIRVEVDTTGLTTPV